LQPSPEVQKVLDRLDKVRKDGSGWSARCPCRDDDQNPSLHVGQGRDGRALLTCHRGGGCNLDEICTAINLTPKDLFPPSQEPRKKKGLELVEEYPYCDTDGQILFWKARYVEDGKKTFRQYRKIRGEKVWNLDGIPKVLYRLPAVTEAVETGDVIVVVEGERDVHTAEALGFTATTMPGGAGKWLDLHTEALAGAKEVVIVADNDDAGMAHADMVVEALRPVVDEVSVWRAPAPHKDLTDLIVAGGSWADLEPCDTGEAPDPLDAVFERLRGSEGPLERRVAKALRQIRAIEAPVADPGRLVHWIDFVGETADDAYDWVVPGLLERGDRVIVVAGEGAGKTYLMRHMALCLGAGVHPFTRGAMPPVRTLMVDLENPDRIIRRTGRRILGGIRQAARRDPDAHLLIRPQGMNLLKPGDQAWLHERIEQIQPDVVFVGPLYKSFIDPGGRTSEAVTTEVAMALDEIRTEFNVAMVFEHHAPLGDRSGREIRPFGSSVWSRWPEFGIGLAPDPDAPGTLKVTHWRGARDERDWPVALRRSTGLFAFEADFG
jgi:hypothetical protein